MKGGLRLAIGKNIFALAERLGYEFVDIKLLESALTHSSYTNELSDCYRHPCRNEGNRLEGS